MSKNKRSSRKQIPKSAGGSLRSFPTVHNRKAHEGGTDDLPPSFSFYHFDTNKECPSEWTGEQVKALFALMQMASSMLWRRVKDTGGSRGGKVGVGFTPVEPKDCKRKLPDKLAEDVDLSEMRVDNAARIFGIRHEATYYVIWLDRNHLVLPG